MGLFMRRRRPLMRLAAGAAVVGTSAHAGTRRAEQKKLNDEAQAAYAATQGPPARAAEVERT